MPFIRTSFLFLFFPLFLILYYIVPIRFKNLVLVIGSLLISLWFDPAFFLIQINLSIVTYIFGYLLSSKGTIQHIRKTIFISSVVISVGVLLYFYIGQHILTLLETVFSVSNTTQILTPLGIAYYVLSCVSYLIDVYYDRAQRQESLIDYLAYIVMFPKLYAGPVVAYANIAGQLQNRKISPKNAFAGVCVFIRGFAKKLLLADTVYSLYTDVLSQGFDNIPMATAWLAALSFLLALYFDFSGYSDMAIGIGKMLGFSFPVNFRKPLISKSVTEFFTRWNISLFHWFRTYLHIPGNMGRNNKRLWIVNVLLIAVAIAIWHGIKLNFFLAALYFTIIIILEQTVLLHTRKKCPHFIRTIITFLLILIGSILASQTTPLSLGTYILALLGLNGQPCYNNTTLYYLSAYIIPFIICYLCMGNFFYKRIHRIKKSHPKLYTYAHPICLSVLFIMSIAFLVATPAHDFLCIIGS
mgnify:CR=1 FL=1